MRAEANSDLSQTLLAQVKQLNQTISDLEAKIAKQKERNIQLRMKAGTTFM